jgi:hypothetical protein
MPNMTDSSVPVEPKFVRQRKMRCDLQLEAGVRVFRYPGPLSSALECAFQCDNIVLIPGYSGRRIW